MRLSVHHTTRYSFGQPIAHGMQRLRMKPKSTQGQRVIEWTMDLTGALPQVEYDDQHHNTTTLVSITPGTRELVIACATTVDTADNAGIIGQHSGHMPLWCFLRQTPLTQPGTRMKALVDKLDADRGDRLATLHALSHAVATRIQYQPGTTDALTRGEDALAAGRGVCQDHAHVFIGCGRLLDIPTRYVSGYLRMDGLDQQEAGHGWAEAHVDGLGWVGVDVANSISPDARYVRVATGRDYGEAAPITGLTQGAGAATLAVDVVVTDVGAAPAAQQQQQQHGGAGEGEPASPSGANAPHAPGD